MRAVWEEYGGTILSAVAALLMTGMATAVFLTEDGAVAREILRWSVQLL